MPALRTAPGRAARDPGAVARRRPAASQRAGRSPRVRIGIQPGLTYLPFVLMQHDHMIEQRAAEAGLGSLTVTWWSVAGGNVMNDAMLAGSLDIANSGTPAFFPALVEDRRLARRQGIAAYNALPLQAQQQQPQRPHDRGLHRQGPDRAAGRQGVVSGHPARDGGRAGRSARASMTGSTRSRSRAPIPIQWSRCSRAAARSPAHFGAPPYQDAELRNPAIHTVLTGTDVTGGPTTIGMAYAMRKFHDATRSWSACFLAALGAAIERINRRPCRRRGDLSRRDQGKGHGREHPGDPRRSRIPVRPGTAKYRDGRPLHAPHRIDQARPGIMALRCSFPRSTRFPGPKVHPFKLNQPRRLARSNATKQSREP
ncbi:MAG: hypothetical protein WDO24_09305 [Pseudomonadota bacterium]